MADKPDKSYAHKAKSIAKRSFDKGNMPEAEYKQVVALADKMIAKAEPDTDDDRTELYARSRATRFHSED